MGMNNIKVFQTEITTAAQELLADKSAELARNSGGAFSMSADAYAGDFKETSYYASTMAEPELIDVYGVDEDAEQEPITQDSTTDVKIAGITKEMTYSAFQLAWMQREKGEALMVIAEGFADRLIRTHVNTGIMAAVAALKNQGATVVNDVSATDDIGYYALNQSYAKFGDSSSNIITDVMTGYMYHKLIGDNITNENRLFTAGNVRIVNINGRNIVVVDSPALVDGGKQMVLSLSNGGIILDNIAQVATEVRELGKKKISYGWRANFSFGLSLKGYSWDQATGGKSPTSAKLATGTNWELKAQDVKNSLGVLTIGNGGGLARAETRSTRAK